MPTTSCGVPSTSIAAADDRRVGREAALPQAVSEHDAAVLSARFLLGEEVAPCDRLDAEHAEEICRHEKALHVLGFVLADQVGVPELPGREPLEGVGLLPLHVEEVGGRHRLLRIDVLRAAVREQRDAIGVGHRERAQHERVDHLEDGGVGADAERQRDDNDRAHGRPFADAAERVSCFEVERSHEGISG